MKNLYLLLALCMHCTLHMYAQQAPDFTATTITGESIHLQSLLDEGKTVVLKFFAVYCPPCNAQAPLLVNLHNDYAATGNVEVITIARYDDDESVQGFDEQHGITFPSISSDGGAVAIESSYAATFGSVGFPRYAVICPDGSTTWNVSPSSNMQAIRNEVDVCLTQNAGTPVAARLMLESFYQTSTNSMHTTLADNNALPSTHPYGFLPWIYTGNENTNNFPNNTVDWVLVELYAANNPTNLVAQKAAILLSNGAISDLDGSGLVHFSGLPADNYYLLIRHRNHLDVMSNNAISIPNDLSPYDFTTSTGQALDAAQQQMGNGTAVLHMGDLDGNGCITRNDFNRLVSDKSSTANYIASDLNSDQTTNSQDFEVLRNKFGVNAPQIVRY